MVPPRTNALQTKATTTTNRRTRTRKRPKKTGLGHRNLPAIRQWRGEDSVSCPILSLAKSRSSTISKGDVQERNPPALQTLVGPNWRHVQLSFAADIEKRARGSEQFAVHIP